MILRLASGSLTPASASRKRCFAFHVNDVQTEVVTKHVHDLLGFIQTQQTVVHEYAGQVFTDSAVQQHRGYGGVNATGRARITLSSPTC